MGTARSVVRGSCLAALVLATAAPALANGPDLRHAIRTALPSVVSVVARGPCPQAGSATRLEYFFGVPCDDSEETVGTGFVVHEPGLVVTGEAVVRDRVRFLVGLPDGRTLEASVRGVDVATGLALLAIPPADSPPPLRWGDDDRAEVGQWVVCLGTVDPAHSPAASAGILSARDWSGVGMADYERWLVTDALLQRGSSGGPMLDVRGDVIGVTLVVRRQVEECRQPLGLAVPAREARAVVEQLQAAGEVRRGYLGVVLQDMTPTLTEALAAPPGLCALVTNVVPATPAAAAGLTGGTLICTIDREPVRSVADLRSRLAHSGPDRTVRLGLRAGCPTGGGGAQAPAPDTTAVAEAPQPPPTELALCDTLLGEAGEREVEVRLAELPEAAPPAAAPGEAGRGPGSDGRLR